MVNGVSPELGGLVRHSWHSGQGPACPLALRAVSSASSSWGGGHCPPPQAEGHRGLVALNTFIWQGRRLVLAAPPTRASSDMWTSAHQGAARGGRHCPAPAARLLLASATSPKQQGWAPQDPSQHLPDSGHLGCSQQRGTPQTAGTQLPAVLHPCTGKVGQVWPRGPSPYSPKVTVCSFHLLTIFFSVFLFSY